MEQLAITQDIANLVAGSYTVTVVDVNSCTASATFTIAEPAAIIIPAAITNVSCYGGNNGAINTNPSGGTPPYQYLWSNGILTQDLTALVANSYTLLVTDTNNCTRQDIFNVTEPDSILLTDIITTVTCNGDSSGSINLTASGGTGTLAYLWSNGSTNEDQNNLASATYIVTVTDANNCSKQESFVVAQPSAIAINVSVIDVGCNGASSGSIDITTSGGTGTISYLWSNGSTIEDQINLTANSYTVTATDANNCTLQQTYIVNQASVISISGTVDSVSCNGLTDGAINITASGGTGTLTYLWSNGSTIEDQTNLSVNTYTVTVTDSLSCTAQQSFTVSEPNAITIAATITDVTCNGGADGAITINASGGTGTLIYLWSNTSIIEDQVNLTANTYTVTATDANNCTSQQTYIIAEPTPISIIGSITPVSCNSGNNGAIDITATGGTGTLTYLWSNASILEDQSNLIENTYTVTVTDGNNCSSQQTFIVTQPVSIVITGTVLDVSCNGAATGAIDISVNGGTTPYTFLWSNLSVAEDQTNLFANTYTVTVTDSNNCTSQQSFVVNQSLPISITGAVVNDSCNSSATGAIDITVTGGLGGFTYLWNNSSTLEDQTNLGASSYTVTVTDISGCTGQEIFNLTEPPPVVISSIVTHVTCNGDSDGAVDISALGGTGILTYLWSNSSTIEDQANLLAGTLTLTVTDFNGCNASETFIITEPLLLTATFNSTNSTCFQNNGTSTVIPTGGNGGYTYLWSTSATVQTITTLAPATYTVTVTDSLFCSQTFSTTIIEVSGLTVATDSIINVNCNGSSDGAVNISLSGGTFPYLYLWSNTETTQDISGLIAGTYIVTITDSAFCVETDTFIVSEPTPVIASFSIANAACGQANGSAMVVASGGSPSYTYLWSNSIITDSISNVFAGIYTVTITDTHSCSSVFSDSIGDDAGPSIQIDSIIDANCFSGNDGAIYTTGSGGTPPLFYLWSNSDTTDDITGLVAQNYTVTVTDNRGCTASLNPTVGEPSLVSLSFNSTTANCNSNNGTAQVNVNGGTSPYQYLWSNNDTTSQIQNLFPGTYTVTITDNHGCVSSDTVSIANSGIPQISLFDQTNVNCSGGNNGSLTISASNGIAPYAYVWSNGDTSNITDTLSAGIYTVTVTDQTGCTQSASYNISQPTLVTLQFTITPEPCDNGNGSASVTANGGIPGYSYLWSTNDTTSVVTQLVAGNYTVTVTDQNGCSIAGMATVTSIAAPQIALTSVTNLTCNGIATGAINITVSGGAPSYSYLWSNSQTTEDLNNLQVGIYSLTVTDANNCQDTISVTITEPDIIVIGFTVTSSTCNNSNGSINTTINGGTGIYSYQWSNNATTSAISNIPAAVYTLTVTDANNCEKTETITVSDIDGPSVTTQSIQTVTCNGGSDGGIIVSITQGIPPYNYLWSNGSTLQNISGVVAGVYFLTVTDSNGCVIQFGDTVTEPPAIIISAAITNATCNLNNGFITVTPIGGTANFLYLWSTGAQSSTISSLAASVVYSISIVDANGCAADSSFTLINTGSPMINIVSTTNVTCFGGNNGIMDIDVNSGIAPYQFFWSNNTQSEDLQNLIAGAYTLTVTDSMGCTSTQLFTITEPPEIIVTFPFVQNANCNQDNGLVVTNVTGVYPDIIFCGQMVQLVIL